MEIVLEKISKKFEDKLIFEEFNLIIENNISVAILGESGKGKSTLLNILGLFTNVDSGNIIIDGVNVQEEEFNKMQYWRYKVGYLFQNYALVDNLSVDKNLDIALEYVKKDKKEKEKIKIQALNKVGLTEKRKKKIYTLSGGEQQRVAIARLLVKPCEIILADEPTGALDNKNKMEIIELLKEIKDSNKNLVIVTHDKEVASICDKIIEL